MPQSENRIPTNVDVRMLCKAEADIFDPFALTVGCIHAQDNGNVEKFLRFAALKCSLNVGLSPT